MVWPIVVSWQVVATRSAKADKAQVYLVRGSARLNARNKDIQQILSFNPWGTSMADTRARLTGEFVDAVSDYGRAESPAELGALKEFKLSKR